MHPSTQPRIFEPFFTTKERGTGHGARARRRCTASSKQSGGSHLGLQRAGARQHLLGLSPPGRSSRRRRPARTQPSRRTASGHARPCWWWRTRTRCGTSRRRALRRRLLGAGGPAGGGGRADQRQHPGTIHLLLTDVVMPRTSGPQLAAKLREPRPTLRVVYMSGFTENALEHHGVLDPSTDLPPEAVQPAGAGRQGAGGARQGRCRRAIGSTVSSPAGRSGPPRPSRAP